eukprot:TRINITY_DN2707_c2_g1_i1.p1 TRINITY_DN2707_c2_g1~~TRINITY_DN2707_c2_g1_i1.p1  ORF type:complete len:205 (+),score=41.06 TRINITY_DN2707_c2_g1_i1:3-617(+)
MRYTVFVLRASSQLEDDVANYIKVLAYLKSPSPPGSCTPTNAEFVLPRSVALTDSVKNLINVTNRAIQDAPNDTTAIMRRVDPYVSEVVAHTRKVLEVLMQYDTAKTAFTIDFGKINTAATSSPSISSPSSTGGRALPLLPSAVVGRALPKPSHPPPVLSSNTLSTSPSIPTPLPPYSPPPSSPSFLFPPFPPPTNSVPLNPSH